MKNLARQWRALSLEKKLGILLPLVATLITGALVPILLAGDGGSGEDREEAARLEVIDLAVTDGIPGSIDEPLKPQAIDITVRNAGDLVSVIGRIAFRVLDSGFLEICEAGGGLEPSETYVVELPPDPEPGDVLEDKVSQQIPPGEADRFTVGLEVPEPDRQLGRHLYQLEVLLYHDAESDPVNAGTVLVSAPLLPDQNFFWSAVPASQRASFLQPAARSVVECLKGNEATYERMLALEGERSPELTAALTEVPE